MFFSSSRGNAQTRNNNNSLTRKHLIFVESEGESKRLKDYTGAVVLLMDRDLDCFIQGRKLEKRSSFLSISQRIGETTNIRACELNAKDSIVIHRTVELPRSNKSSWTRTCTSQCCSNDRYGSHWSTCGGTRCRHCPSVDVQAHSIRRTKRLRDVGPHIHLQRRNSRRCYHSTAGIENIDTHKSSKCQTPHRQTCSLTYNRTWSRVEWKMNSEQMTDHWPAWRHGWALLHH